MEPRSVLVTGAGSGLGLAIAQHLARHGYRVVGTVRSPARAELLTRKAQQEGLPLRYLPLELTSAADRDAVVHAMEAQGGLDVLVNNAGFGIFGAIEEVPAQAVARQFAVHVCGPLELTRRLLPLLRESKGRILWIGSLAGRLALPFQAHYSATKAAIASLSDALRIELAPHGVEVTCIEPGDFATGFTQAREVLAPAGSAYAVQVATCLAAAQEQERSGGDAVQVARVVARLLQRRHPPARRPVGRLARMMSLLARLLPEKLRERLVAQNYGLELHA